MNKVLRMEILTIFLQHLMDGQTPIRNEKTLLFPAGFFLNQR